MQDFSVFLTILWAARVIELKKKLLTVQIKFWRLCPKKKNARTLSRKKLWKNWLTVELSFKQYINSIVITYTAKNVQFT